MSPEAFWLSAALLLPERIAYGLIWRAPDRFRLLTKGLLRGSDPVDVLAALFVLFKLLQGAVFAGWHLAHGGRWWPLIADPAAALAGAAMMAVGQVLNLSVFARLGRTGVFYGHRLGHDLPWVDGFPFSWLRHPQYVGTVASIWGLFIALRYPAPDWIALPLLETVYYVIGAHVERDPRATEALPSAPGDRA